LGCWGFAHVRSPACGAVSYSRSTRATSTSRTRRSGSRATTATARCWRRGRARGGRCRCCRTSRSRSPEQGSATGSPGPTTRCSAAMRASGSTARRSGGATTRPSGRPGYGRRASTTAAHLRVAGDHPGVKRAGAALDGPRRHRHHHALPAPSQPRRRGGAARPGVRRPRDGIDDAASRLREIHGLGHGDSKA
jgi:hypothetical protein